MIRAIFIPADRNKPMSLHEIDASHPGAYRAFVGSQLQVIDLHAPDASLYFNGKHKFLMLPLNIRATNLANRHQTPMMITDFIGGDALLTGPADENGNDLSVPDAYREELEVRDVIV